jgi:2,3-bisphosphoglycerate-dependent phosphoglycerate mutase
MILYCVRHGETVYNAVGRIQGQTNSELSDLGRRQCQAVAVALARQPIEAVYSSPLKRALEGAQSLADELRLEVRLDDRLMEINAGIFQGLDWNDIEVRYPQEAVRWRTQDPDFRIPQGESRRDVMNRAAAVFAAIREAGHRQAAVIAHGGLLSAALKVLLGVPAERNPFSLNNGSISKLGWDKEVKLLALNLTDHLQEAVGGGGDL